MESKNGFLNFVPDIASCEINGFLETTRVVLPNKEDTDARPSIINEILPGYISVFTGKIDHCIWVAEDISEIISSYLNEN